MAELSLRVVEVIRECTATLLTFAFSRPRLAHIAEFGLQGEWDTYRRTLLELPEARVERACFELALFLRYLDEDQDLSAYVANNSNLQLGTLLSTGKPDEVLSLREVSNKIIHSSSFDWDFGDASRPQLVCIAREPEKWSKARIDVLNLACVSGNLIDAWGAR